jgi:hypothetical protein
VVVVCAIGSVSGSRNGECGIGVSASNEGVASLE